MSILLPQDFATYTRQLFGDERYECFVASFDEIPPVSLRLNPLKPGKKFVGEPIPWCQNAYWLKERENFTLDPLFHAGCYYVQEAASMFLDQILRQYVTHPISMLDLCAAPGGKATLARATLPTGSLLYCNETDHRRANILIENVMKQGYRDIFVTTNLPRDYAQAGMLFDVILTDVPCSGEGMFRKDPIACQEWSVGNVMRLATLQRSIVSDIWSCLKMGGLLIYSTCTFNTRENEENLRWIVSHLGGEVLAVDTRPEWGIVGSLLPDLGWPVYRFIPGLTRSEGLFIAVVRKTTEETNFGRPRPSLLRTIYDGTLAERHDDCPAVDVPLNVALQYLRHEAIRLPEEAPRGLIRVSYQGHTLGLAKNIGTRANNLYPREWRIRNK